METGRDGMPNSFLLQIFTEPANLNIQMNINIKEDI
jgi:hypothetical protein